MGEKLTYSQRIVKFRASYDETVFRLLESMGELFTHSQRTGFIQYFASWKIWASYSPTVTDRVYTAVRLFESMGVLLTRSQRI